MTWVLEGRKLESVLVTRLRYLGDVVMATVVLQALRLGDADLELGFLCERPHAAALQGHPLLSSLHILDAGRLGADARVRSGLAGQETAGVGTLRMIRQLRARRYDLAVDLFFNPRSAWLLKGAGIPLRIGGTAGWRRRLYTHTALNQEPAGAVAGWPAAAPGGLGHHLGRLGPLTHLESGLPFAAWLVRTCGAQPLRPRIANLGLGAAGRAALQGLDLDPAQEFLLLCPGATWRSKEWPLGRWGELVGALVGDQDRALVVLTPPDRQLAWAGLAEAIPRGRGGVLAPLSLADVLGVVGAAAAMVTVDGGVMHAGVGMGIPTVALFGPTDPDIWFPYVRSGICAVLATRPGCHPCHRHACDQFVCLPDLQAQAVAAALYAVLDRPRPREQPHPVPGIKAGPGTAEHSEPSLGPDGPDKGGQT